MSHDCKSIPCDVCGGEPCPLCHDFSSTWNETHRMYIHDECVAEYEAARHEYFGGEDESWLDTDAA